MFYKRSEGYPYRCGFNYTTTKYGHGIEFQLCLFKGRRIRLGYYWGRKFRLRVCTFNRHEQERLLKDFQSPNTHLE